MKTKILIVAMLLLASTMMTGCVDEDEYKYKDDCCRTNDTFSYQFVVNHIPPEHVGKDLVFCLDDRALFRGNYEGFQFKNVTLYQFDRSGDVEKEFDITNEINNRPGIIIENNMSKNYSKQFKLELTVDAGFRYDVLFDLGFVCLDIKKKIFFFRACEYGNVCDDLNVYSTSYVSKNEIDRFNCGAYARKYGRI